MEHTPLTFATLDCPADMTHGVGGDLSLVFPLSEGRTGIAIGDFAGHGAQAAAHAAVLKYLLRLLADQDCSPAQVLGRLNCSLMVRLPLDSMATLFFGILSADASRLEYASAGHTPPYVFSADGQMTVLQTTGPVLGMSPFQHYTQATFTLQAGDILALFTDGLSEARRCCTGEFLGEPMLQRFMRRHVWRDLPLQTRVEQIYEEVCDFSGREAQADDATLMLFELPHKSSDTESVGTLHSPQAAMSHVYHS